MSMKYPAEKRFDFQMVKFFVSVHRIKMSHKWHKYIAERYDGNKSAVPVLFSLIN